MLIRVCREETHSSEVLGSESAAFAGPAVHRAVRRKDEVEEDEEGGGVEERGVSAIKECPNIR